MMSSPDNETEPISGYHEIRGSSVYRLSLRPLARGALNSC